MQLSESQGFVKIVSQISPHLLIRLALDNLGCHPIWAPDERISSTSFVDYRYPKISDFDEPSPRQESVGSVEITVQNKPLVQKLQRVAHLIARHLNLSLT